MHIHDYPHSVRIMKNDTFTSTHWPILLRDNKLAILAEGERKIFDLIPNNNILTAIRSLSINQLLVLMSLIKPLAAGRVIHLTQGSRACELVNTMPESLKALLSPCLEPAPRVEIHQNIAVNEGALQSAMRPQAGAAEQAQLINAPQGILGTLVNVVHQHPALTSGLAAAASLAAYLLSRK